MQSLKNYLKDIKDLNFPAFEKTEYCYPHKQEYIEIYYQYPWRPPGQLVIDKNSGCQYCIKERNKPKINRKIYSGRYAR